MPLKTENDINIDGKYFCFEEIENNIQNFSKNLGKELEHLKDAASLWKEYYL